MISINYFFNSVEEFAFWTHLSKRIGGWNRDVSLQGAGEIKAWGRKWRRRLNVGRTAAPIEKGPGGRTWHLEPCNWDAQRCIPYSEGEGKIPLRGSVHCSFCLGSCHWWRALWISRHRHWPILSPFWTPLPQTHSDSRTLGSSSLFSSPCSTPPSPPGEYFPVHIRWPQEPRYLFIPLGYLLARGGVGFRESKYLSLWKYSMEACFCFFPASFRSIPVEGLFGHQVAEWLWQVCWLQKISHYITKGRHSCFKKCLH